MSKLKDEEPFVEIQVERRDSGIYVRLGSKGKVLNTSDAQFLCDALYVMLDEIRLEEDDE
jgi:hypothetical protein